MGETWRLPPYGKEVPPTAQKHCDDCARTVLASCSPPAVGTRGKGVTQGEPAGKPPPPPSQNPSGRAGGNEATGRPTGAPGTARQTEQPGGEGPGQERRGPPKGLCLAACSHRARIVHAPRVRTTKVRRDELPQNPPPPPPHLCPPGQAPQRRDGRDKGTGETSRCLGCKVEGKRRDGRTKHCAPRASGPKPRPAATHRASPQQDDRAEGRGYKAHAAASETTTAATEATGRDTSGDAGSRETGRGRRGRVRGEHGREHHACGRAGRMFCTLHVERDTRARATPTTARPRNCHASC